ncbi:MAG: DinB family protein [Phycisphaerales bacterium]
MGQNPAIGCGADAVRRLHEHRVWMRGRLLDACAGVSAEAWVRPFDMGRGSLWSTVEHLYAAERVWISALEGDGQVSVEVDLEPGDLAGLRAAWEPIDRRWGAFLATLTDEMLGAPVERYSAVWKRHYTTYAGDVLLHVATHAAYTTAQAMNMLRRLGVRELPGMDLILMACERWDASAGPGGTAASG